MKKLYSRFSKVSLPIFGRNLSVEDAAVATAAPTVVTRSRNSGSYDFELAQKEYDRCRSLPNSIYVNSDTSSSDGRYEDASSRAHVEDVDYYELYDDVNPIPRPVEQTANGGNEYDVPRISFSFFEQAKAAMEREAAEEEEKEEDEGGEESLPANIKSEVTITVTEEDSPKTTSFEIRPLMGLIKCGSDPNLVFRRKSQEPDGNGDSFYKIPRCLNPNKRLSQSLTDLVNADSADPLDVTPTSNQSSIEHISCSQVLVQPSTRQLENQNQDPNSQSSENMDYCKVRSRLPMKLRRPTFLSKPKKAIDKWNELRSKFNNIITDHEPVYETKDSREAKDGATKDSATKQSFEGIYKNSKTKCKKAIKRSKDFFKNRTASDSVDSETSSQIVKNDAFFARVPITPSDIQYKFEYSPKEGAEKGETPEASPAVVSKNEEEDRFEFDFSTIKSRFRRSRFVAEGQNGFEDLRRYVKQGGDFCKELSTILQERAETETHYAKSLSKLSAKLSRACREGVGGVNEAWKAVALEMESRAEVHRLLGTALLEETARPLKNLNENQHRARKQCESAVDKSAKSLADWRAGEAKSKKQSHTCARDNEKLQDAAVLDTSKSTKLTLNRSSSLIQLAHNKTTNTDKENAKLEGKKRKAEDAVKKADIEYYTLCVRAERARLEWESAVLRGVNTFQEIEEERLNNLKTVLTAYLHHGVNLGPRLIEAAESLKNPVLEAEPTKDLGTFINLRQSSQQVSEQLLPDFYCEHITLAMNRERRKQALVKLVHLIRQDIERERKSKNGLENLSKAIKQTPNFGAEDSQQSVSEKLYHMKSMLTYLEGARYKVHNALAELDSRPRSGHPLAPHITITRDKSGLQQSVLKVPQWLREEWFETEKSPLSEKSLKSDKSDNSDPHNNDLADPDWSDRGAADGNSNQPDSDFDEFSSQCSSSGNLCGGPEESQVHPIAQCKAIYAYTPNLTDELALNPGDLLSVYRQQDDGWWLGECRGNVGIFPATYVELVNSN